MSISNIRQFVLPKQVYTEIIKHALRKVRKEYHADEHPEPKAYGLIGGHTEGDKVRIIGSYPLKKNTRGAAQHKEKMDTQMQAYATPSVTPMEERGWIADADEVWEAVEQFSNKGGLLVGNYHTHRVAWEHDPVRDTCTKIDRQLAKGSGQWVFIVSVVDPDKPILRVFYEGVNEKEATITIQD